MWSTEVASSWIPIISMLINKLFAKFWGPGHVLGCWLASP